MAKHSHRRKGPGLGGVLLAILIVVVLIIGITSVL